MKPTQIDGWVLADPKMARAILTGRQRQMRVPLAAPLAAIACEGAVIGLREACVPGRRRSDGVEMATDRKRAEFVAFADGWRRDRSGRQWRAESPRDAAEKWLAAMHMPGWATRAQLVIERRTTCRLRAIGAEELVAEGYRTLLPLAFWSRRRFAARWDVLHPQCGLRWADDPEVAVLRFRTRRL
ncbi:hypothetical protein [Novosphingobium sp.]|uniref:hypothetical protein n=1 Tax=Novosphingobium sp. TaxID=1874826 RepID=UPI0038BB4CB7